MPSETVRARVRDRFSAALGCEKGAALEILHWNETLGSLQRDSIPLVWDDPRVVYRYTTRALSLEYNLKQNDALRDRVYRGTLPLRTFIGLKPHEMDPVRYEAVFERVARKQLRKQHTSDPDSMPDGAFVCRCGSKKTVFYQMQTRSADEPMTTFINCVACGKRWKQ